MHPLRTGNSGLAAQYRRILLGNSALVTVPLSAAIAGVAAGIRARYNLGTPDSIQIATALDSGAIHLLTNDARLARVTELRVLVLDELP